MPVSEIRVQGLLDASWSDRLSGMAISRIETEDNAPVMMLVGYLTDQAALAGVLNVLYDLHLPLLLVKCLDSLENFKPKWSVSNSKKG